MDKSFSLLKWQNTALPHFSSLLFLQQECHPLFNKKFCFVKIFVSGYGLGVGGQVLAAGVVSVRKQGCPMLDTVTSRQLQQTHRGNG